MLIIFQEPMVTLGMSHGCPESWMSITSLYLRAFLIISVDSSSVSSAVACHKIISDHLMDLALDTVTATRPWKWLLWYVQHHMTLSLFTFITCWTVTTTGMSTQCSLFLFREKLQLQLTSIRAGISQPLWELTYNATPSFTHHQKKHSMGQTR